MSDNTSGHIGVGGDIAQLDLVELLLVDRAVEIIALKKIEQVPKPEKIV